VIPVHFLQEANYRRTGIFSSDLWEHQVPVWILDMRRGLQHSLQVEDTPSEQPQRSNQGVHLQRLQFYNIKLLHFEGNV
jgi:hypothetical protein